MEIDETSKTTTTTTAGDSKAATKSTGEVLPESDVYVRLLLILGLVDVKEVEKVSSNIPSQRSSDTREEHGSPCRQGLVLLGEVCRAIETGRGSSIVRIRHSFALSRRLTTSLTLLYSMHLALVDSSWRLTRPLRSGTTKTYRPPFLTHFCAITSTVELTIRRTSS
jgi:hypothetical protein